MSNEIIESYLGVYYPWMVNEGGKLVRPRYVPTNISKLAHPPSMIFSLHSGFKQIRFGADPENNISNGMYVIFYQVTNKGE